MLGFCVAAGTLPVPALQLLLNAALYDPGAQRAQRAEAARCLAQSIWLAAPADRLQWAQRICSAVQVQRCRGGGRLDEQRDWAGYSLGSPPFPFTSQGAPCSDALKRDMLLSALLCSTDERWLLALESNAAAFDGEALERLVPGALPTLAGRSASWKRLVLLALAGPLPGLVGQGMLQSCLVAARSHLDAPLRSRLALSMLG